MKPYYQDKWVTIYHGDCRLILPTLEKVDLVVTDPPYGIGFMGKDWDKALPDKKIWSECLRVLKPGAFAFVMSIPRADCLSRMIISLEDAGFNVGFSPIYWAYASGFPKAGNIAKQINKAIDNIKRKLYNSSIWSANLNDVKSAEQLYLSELTEAGLLTVSSDFVVANVVQYFKAKSINASANIVASSLSEAPLTLGTNTFIVPENADTLPKPNSLSVHTVELNLDGQGQRMSIRIVFVPVDVQTCICEKVESKIKEGVVQKTGSGKPKSWNEMDIDALCVEVIEDLKLIILSQLRSTLNCDTNFQTELLSATNVIITKSIRECLLTKTANILGKRKDGRYAYHFQDGNTPFVNAEDNPHNEVDSRIGLIERPTTPQAKALDGSYGGFQPKPSVEVIIVAMKPLSEKTFVDQALKNGKGITWLDDCRIPYESEDKPSGGFGGMDTGIGKPLEHQVYRGSQEANSSGRFPANLLVSDDVLNDGVGRKSGGRKGLVAHQWTAKGREGISIETPSPTNPDSGSFSRYFDLDKWAQKTFPFLIVPKASKSEKNKGCEGLPLSIRPGNYDYDNYEWDATKGHKIAKPTHNNHPTVKPLKLMSYLITLGSREGDTVLDPFLGSGTTAVACTNLNRKCIGIEISEKYCEIAANRCRQEVMGLKI